MPSPKNPNKRKLWLENMSKARIGKVWNIGLTKETDKRIKKLSEKRKQKIGSLSTNWKGGRINIEGYTYILCLKHPYSNSGGYYAEHRLVMEKHLGRYLTPKEVVHHIDGDKLNNKIENLYLFENNSAHTDYHGMLRHFVREMLKMRGELNDMGYHKRGF